MLLIEQKKEKIILGGNAAVYLAGGYSLYVSKHVWDFQLFLFWAILVLISNVIVYTRKLKYDRCTIICTLIFSFGFIGNALFIWPVVQGIKLGNLVKYLIDVLFFLPLVRTLVYLIENLSVFILKENIFESVNKVRLLRYRKADFVLFCTLSALIVCSLYVVIYNPTNVSYDAYRQSAEAMGLLDVEAYFGLFYIYFLRIVYLLFSNIVVVSYLQYIFFAYIFAEILYYVYLKTKVSIKWLIVLYLVILLSPNISIMLTFVSKDVPYALAITWMTVCLCILSDKEILIKKSIYVEFSISIVLVALIRQNGLVVVPFVFICSLFLLKDKNVLKTYIISFIVIGIMANILTEAEYIPTPNGYKYVGLFQDLYGVYHNGGNLDKEVSDLIDEVADDKLRAEYTPYHAVDWEYTLTERMDNMKVSDFLSMYIKTAIKNPAMMVKLVLCRNDSIWDIYVGMEGVEALSHLPVKYENPTELALEEFIPIHKYNNGELVLDKIGGLTMLPVFKGFFWRVGLSFQIIFIILVLSIRDRKNMVAFLPVAAHVLFCFIALGWSSYRYSWCISIVMPVILLNYFCKKNRI
ncbi:hypothetical protein [Candidatus Merdisoma sp. JLR.KK006]|uniref:hypothetical protein n=1 Tax=Candidatus Merdisoma sp. JLR.KK006 TaxID=3112626 RepID=UPI002FF0D47F